MKKILLILSAFFMSTSLVFPGGWTQKKGNAFIKIDYRFLSAEKVYDMKGDKIDIQGFDDKTISLYGEYGLIDELTIISTINIFKDVSFKLSPAELALYPKNSASGFGDIDLGIKYKISEFNQYVFSAQLEFGIPTGEDSPTGGAILGDGEFNQAIALQLGKSFYPTPLYANLITKYNNRTKGYSDEFLFGIEGGYAFLPNLNLILRFHGKKSMKNGDGNYHGGYAGLYATNQEYIAFGPELAYMFANNFGINASYETGGAGKNIYSAPVFTFGIFFRN